MGSVPDLGISSKEQELAGGIGRVGSYSPEDVVKLPVVQRLVLLDTMIEERGENDERGAYPARSTPATSRTRSCPAPPE